MHTIGVILAGGVGARLGLDVPKQMVKVAGKTVLEHTVEALHSSDAIDELIVMMTPGWSETAATLLGDRFPKLTRILDGGATRNETTLRVLNAIEEEECKIILHDAVRPFVDDSVIQACADALDEFQAVDVVIPSSDTIVEVDRNDLISAIPNRDFLRRGQTPQAFHISVLRRAYEIAQEDPNFKATDDCGVVLKYLPEIPIKTVPGTDHNIKVTHPVDLFIADKLFQLVTKSAPDLDEVAAREYFNNKTIVILGGSYGIGAEIATIARKLGANVVAHGRSTTGVHAQNPQEVEAALEEAAREHGGIDAVVLTAGVLQMGAVHETSDEDIELAVGVNYLAPIYVARAAHKYLKETAGHLLLFTSSSYTRGRENYAVYSSAKAAVVNLTQALSEEWSKHGIKVNVVNPERTATPMRSAAFGEEPVGSLLSAEQVADTSLAVLASDLTGCVIDVRKEKFA